MAIFNNVNQNAGMIKQLIQLFIKQDIQENLFVILRKIASEEWKERVEIWEIDHRPKQMGQWRRW